MLFSCRARFPLPVIFYRGKYICRSATLSGGPEIYSRTGFDYLFCGDNTNPKPNLEGELIIVYSLLTIMTYNLILEPEAYEAQESSLNEEVFVVEEKGREWQLFDRVRNQDIKLLKTLNVGTIADFMVEKKKVKFLMVSLLSTIII